MFLRLALTTLLLTLTARPQELKKVTSIEGVTEYALPNGLRVLLYPDASKPKLTVNITYLVGSRHEGYGEGGMAHLLEHLLFLQTSTRQIKKELTDHGAQWNGTTSWDRTNYFETVTASPENLKWAIELEADRMVNTKMEKALLDTEMTVVRNEFEMGENSPERILFQRTMEAAYTFHNYGKTVIGLRSDIENVPIDRLAAFYRKYYQPDNAVLTIAGQFDEAQALALVQKEFGRIPRAQRKLDTLYTVEPTQDGEREVALRRVGDVQSMIALYHTPAAAHPDSAALDVLASVLGDTPSGRLYKSLVDNKKSVSAAMFSMSMHDPGFIAASVTARKDQSIEEAKKQMLSTVEGIVNEPPTKEEVDRAKTKILKQIELRMTDSQSVGLALSESLAAGDWRLIFHSRDAIKAVTEQDVLRVAKAYLKPSNRTIGVFHPTPKPDRAEIPAAPDLNTLLKDYKGSQKISEGEVFDPAPANIESRLKRSRTAAGMKLALLPKKTRGEKVFAQITLHYGDEKSLFGKSAIAQLTGGLLMRGTKDKNRQQIQDEMDRLKARIFVGGGVTSATANIETTEANLAGALKLAAELLRSPSFPDREFDQLRQQFLAGIERARSEPQMLAGMEMQRHLSPYPKGDVRYVDLPAEQIEDLQKVTLDDVKKFYQQFYGANNAEFTVAGQFDAAQVQKLASELFGDWKSVATYTRVMDTYKKTEPLDRKIETPDKKNSVVMAGGRASMSDEDPAYPAAAMANYLFGGSGASRIFKRIREKEGLSYGAFSMFSAPPKENNGMFIFQAICAPENAVKVEASFKDELARTLKDGFTSEEVAAGKKSYHDQLMVGRSQEQNLIRTLASRERFDRTMRFDEALDAKIAALTVEQVNEAFRRIVDPASLALVKAGDFKKVQ